VFNNSLQPISALVFAGDSGDMRDVRDNTRALVLHGTMQSQAHPLSLERIETAPLHEQDPLAYSYQDDAKVIIFCSNVLT